MASKIDLKQLMIEKGEKIGLGVGAAVMVLLIVVGIMSAAGAESSSKTAADLATPQGKVALRQDLISRFNRALASGSSKQHVSYIIFSDFVMQ